MKKKITAFLLAAAMLLSFAACSEKSDADAIIHECEVPVYDTVDMPLTIETEEDMRTAWKYVINKAIGDGATFNGVPVTRMSQAYFVEEAEKNGFEDFQEGLRDINAKNEHYSVWAGDGIDNYDWSKRLNGIRILFTSIIGDTDVPPESLERFNSEFYLGRASEVLGLDIAEAMVVLEIDDVMLEWLLQFETHRDEYTNYTYEWFEGPEVYYMAQLTHNRDYWGNDIFGLTFHREKEGHSEETCYDMTSRKENPSVSRVSYYENFYNESDESYSKYLKYQTYMEKLLSVKRSAADIWHAVEKIENGVSEQLESAYDIYFEIDMLENAVLDVPGITGGYATAKWESVLTEFDTTENGNVFIYTLKVSEDEGVYEVKVEYCYEQDRMVMYKPDGNIKYIFERI